jgi:hypothetical protein
MEYHKDMDNSKECDSCPNCQNILASDDTFCSKCGQKRIHPKDYSVWHLIVESVGDFFHFDSKFFATLWPLFFRPGFLTNEYLQGKRARYFQPFKLFLFISFLFFLTSGIMNHKESILDQPEVSGGKVKGDSTGFNKESDSLELTLDDKYDTTLAIPDDSLRKVLKKYGLNRYVNLKIPNDSIAHPGITGLKDKTNNTWSNNQPGALKLSLNEAYDKALAIPDDSLRKMVKKYGLSRYVNIKFPGASWFSRFMIKQVVKNRLQGSGTFNDNMQKTTPKLIFILIPFIAFLLKLLYIRKRIPYFNHIIFSVHFLSFVFLLLWIRLFGSQITDKFSVVVYLLLLIYLFIALLKVYRQKKWKTFGKFLLLFFGSLFMLALFFIITASISFLLI